MGLIARRMTLAACSVIAVAALPAGPAASAATAHRARPITWIITASAIDHLRHARPKPAPPSLLSTAFSKAYVPGNPKVAGLGIPMVTYTSYVTLHSDVTAGKLPGPYQAVLLDLEDWSLTPKPERAQPTKYEGMAERLVHGVKLSNGHRMTFIATPATDLATYICGVRNLTCKGSASIRQHYIQFGIAGGAARNSDVMDIQAQNTERDIPAFKKFVQQAAAQAIKARKGIKVLVGLSTDNGPTEVLGSQLIAAFEAVSGQPGIDGFWLNIPGKSTACPRCGGPFPGPALTLLRHIYG
jgi:hypothetical protein